MLTSVRSPRVAAVRRLSRRSVREAEQRFVVEGPQAVAAALDTGGLLELFVLDRQDDLAVRAVRGGGSVVEVSPAVLSAMAGTVSPQGVLGVAALPRVDLDSALGSRPRLVVVLDAARDPGNAGTVIRTADAAGADAVVLAGDSVDPYNGKCVRATAGSLFFLPVVHDVELPDVLDRLRHRGMQVLATSGSGRDDLHELAACGALRAPTAWVFGNEAHGLAAQALHDADRRVRIPMWGRAESLNLAGAAAVCLYTSARAQRA